MFHALLDQELISISLNIGEIELKFTDEILRLSGDFLIVDGQGQHLFRPDNMEGCAGRFWKLIGAKVSDVSADASSPEDRSSIIFEIRSRDSSVKIEILPSDRYRGSLENRHQRYYEEF